MSEEYKTITKEDVLKWGGYGVDYFAELLSGEYPLDAAREDVLSFRRGSAND